MSTLGTPIGGSPSSSMMVLGMDACECHCESMPAWTFPPNMTRGIRDPPIAAYPFGWIASGTVSTAGVGTESA